MPAIVFEALNREKLATSRGGDELSNFDDSALSDFNELARQWPADLLIHIAVYRTSLLLASFIAENRKNES